VAEVVVRPKDRFVAAFAAKTVSYPEEWISNVDPSCEEVISCHIPKNRRRKRPSPMRNWRSSGRVDPRSSEKHWSGRVLLRKQHSRTIP